MKQRPPHERGSRQPIPGAATNRTVIQERDASQTRDGGERHLCVEVLSQFAASRAKLGDRSSIIIPDDSHGQLGGRFQSRATWTLARLAKSPWGTNDCRDLLGDRVRRETAVARCLSTRWTLVRHCVSLFTLRATSRTRRKDGRRFGGLLRVFLIPDRGVVASRHRIRQSPTDVERPQVSRWPDRLARRVQPGSHQAPHTRRSTGATHPHVRSEQRTDQNLQNGGTRSILFRATRHDRDDPATQRISPRAGLGNGPDICEETRAVSKLYGMRPSVRHPFSRLHLRTSSNIARSVVGESTSAP